MLHSLGYVGFKSGAPEKIRIPNLLIRSQVLYPVELRAHNKQALSAFGYVFNSENYGKKQGKS